MVRSPAEKEERDANAGVATSYCSNGTGCRGLCEGASEPKDCILCKLRYVISISLVTDALCSRGWSHFCHIPLDPDDFLMREF